MVTDARTLHLLSLFFIRSLIDKNAEMNAAAAARLFFLQLERKINALIGSGVLDSGADGRTDEGREGQATEIG